MPRTLSDAIADARRLLHDQRAPYRYADTDLMDYANQGLSTMYRLRPDLMVGSAWKPASVPTPTTALPPAVSDWFFPQLVSFMVGMSEARDDQFTADSRVAFFLARLQAGLQGQGV